MRQRILSTTFLVIFFSIIFLVPTYWLFVERNEEVHSVEEERELKKIPVLKYSDFRKAFINVLQRNANEETIDYFNRFILRGFQKNFEASLSDRFPLRINAIKVSRWVDRQVIYLAYLFLDDPAIPTDTQSQNISILNDRSRLIRNPQSYGLTEEKGIDTAINNYNRLISQFPDLNFYIFYIQRIQESAYHPLASYYVNSDRGRSIEYFENNLPKKLVLEKFLFNNYEDKINYFFKTDHHWNIRGACYSYGLIYPMLAMNYPEISSKLDCDQYMVIPDLRFLGSLAKKTLYPIEPEVIEISTVKIPNHMIFDIDGKEIKYTDLAAYLEGDFDDYPYTNHYGNLFGYISKQIEYYFPGNPKRNLLIIGSSYRTPIIPFIASHYQHTFIIDLRYVKNFSLGSYIKEHHVNDLLILGEDTVVFQMNKWQIHP